MEIIQNCTSMKCSFTTGNSIIFLTYVKKSSRKIWPLFKAILKMALHINLMLYLYLLQGLKAKVFNLFWRQHTLTESTGYMTQCSATPAAAPAAATI